MVQQYKIKAVEEIIGKFRESKHIIFTEYKGLDVEKITDLRRKLYDINSEMKIMKNRLAKLAYKKLELKFEDEWFSGPIALVLCKDDDYIKTVKIVCNFSRENEDLKIKRGYLEERIIDIDELEQISYLPSRDDMIVKVVCILNSPVVKMVSVLKNIISKPIMVLRAIENKKK